MERLSLSAFACVFVRVEYLKDTIRKSQTTDKEIPPFVF